MSRSFCRINLLLFAIFCLCTFCICDGNAQTVSKYIVVDQFGYRTESKKVAVIRDPQTGFDAAESFNPGTSYAVVNKKTKERIATASPTQWKNGTTDASSGDRVWWFDFSSVTTPGRYYILDIERNVRSYEFEISDIIYREILKHAVRTFFYQRAGFEKNAAYAGTAWADGASHTQNLQDGNARQYNKPTDASTEVDVSGGWYDAGDYNKYTNWTANYVVDFMRAYIENPTVWGDDYNIPESGNQIPDVLDEAKWGVDHLLRMQKEDGSVLSIVGLSHASPPSAATGPSLYGTPNTSGTLNTAAAFAIASKVYGSIGMTAYAESLKTSAIKAWDWAIVNPAVVFRNNETAAGTNGLGAGQQETDDYGRFIAKMEAACFLFEITGETKYRDFIDENYGDVHFVAWTYATPFETSNNEILLHYTTLTNATSSVVSDIKAKYLSTMSGDEVLPAVENQLDPYRAYLKTSDYTWGSNSTKSAKGLIYTDMIYYGINPLKDQAAENAAEDFIHYLHGVNPLNMVYLSNMYAFGAESSVNEFYHSWFSNGSTKWDRVGTSTYGPAPGFVTGGPNPSYNKDGCCATSTCGGSNNALCNSENVTPPKGQPVQKSYKDFNTSWPLNSWSVTENSNGYQLNYIRLLSKFVQNSNDCNGTLNGGASYDICGNCAGGTTGVTPVTDEKKCNGEVTAVYNEPTSRINVSPNPTRGLIMVDTDDKGEYTITIATVLGENIFYQHRSGSSVININDKPSGVYIIIIQQHDHKSIYKVLKL